MKRLNKFIPMAVLALGLVGALSSFTTDKDSKFTTNIQGYIQLDPMGTQCEASVKCADDFGPLCTVGTTQVWGKTGDINSPCTRELRKNH
ncbi:hypothetical protein [Flavobacterium sp. XGLA_31]|uniref:hypothetical protein n=1 Tax=Flavobacterium sp. XGLA_31 TaxID=3447666 RepID=UPI003F2B6BE1